MLSIVLNLFAIPFPFVSATRVSSGYLDALYRVPGFLGLIGSSGSISYASLFLLSLIHGIVLKKSWYLYSIPFLLLSLLSGSSGLILLLSFLYLILFLLFTLVNFFCPR